VTRRLAILYVDDDAELRFLTSDVLRRSGHDVHTASSASQALELMRRRHFDLLITDCWMPGGNGDDLVRSASEEGLLAHTRVSIITNDPERVACGKAAPKPLGVHALLHHVDRLMTRRSRRERVMRTVWPIVTGLAVMAIVAVSRGIR
jgi:two-component system sensor histidine kinase EvgS